MTRQAVDVIASWLRAVPRERMALLRTRLVRLRTMEAEEPSRGYASDEQLDLEDEFGRWRDVLESVVDLE